MTDQNMVAAGKPLASLARLATLNALSGISRMINQDIGVSRLDSREVLMREARDLLGNPDEIVVGSYLRYSGAAQGHIILSFPESVALDLIDMAMGQPQGTTVDIGEMEASVIGEMGNIAGTYFLNEMANTVHAAVHPSPPAPLRDMAGAIMDVIIAQVMETQDRLYLLDLEFHSNEQRIGGHLLVVPTDGVFSVGHIQRNSV